MKRLNVNKHLERMAIRLLEVHTTKGLAWNPAESFYYRNATHVWIHLVLLPALTAMSALGVMLIGFMAWAPLLFVSVPLGLFAVFYGWSAYVWMNARGWGNAIIEIEHKSGKAAAYEVTK